MPTTYLVTVSGPDRVGSGAELFAALALVTQGEGHLADVAQITIRGSLVLCGEVTVPDTVTIDDVRAAIASRDIERDGLVAAIEVVEQTDAAEGRRLLVTLLAPRIAPAQLQAVFGAFAAADATCERIVLSLIHI